jgi:hypothetical protein
VSLLGRKEQNGGFFTRLLEQIIEKEKFKDE